MKGREGERRAEAAGEDSRRRADVAHANADRRNLAPPHQLQHPHVVARVVGHRADLDDVRIEFRHPGVDFFEVVRRLAEVVVADDPSRAAEAADRPGDVVLEVDVLDPLGDRRPQEHQPLLLRAGVLAAVGRPPAGNDDRAGAIGRQSLDVRLAADVIHAQLDELRALFDEVPVFGQCVTVTAATYADANHGRKEGLGIGA